MYVLTPALNYILYEIDCRRKFKYFYYRLMNMSAIKVATLKSTSINFITKEGNYGLTM